MFIPVLTSFLTVCFNLVIGSTLIIVPLRLKEAGAGIFAITGTLSVWAVVCAVCAWLVGRILTERNARRLVQTGTALYFLCFLTAFPKNEETAESILTILPTVIILF